jgi:hypothetical protein
MPPGVFVSVILYGIFLSWPERFAIFVPSFGMLAKLFRSDASNGHFLVE